MFFLKPSRKRSAYANVRPEFGTINRNIRHDMSDLLEATPQSDGKL